jgi:hypothetical protein
MRQHVGPDLAVGTPDDLSRQVDACGPAVSTPTQGAKIRRDTVGVEDRMASVGGRLRMADDLSDDLSDIVDACPAA